MPSEISRNAFVFGCGFLGKRVGTALINQGWTVGTLTRSKDKGRELAAKGFKPIVGDWTDSRVVTQIPATDLVLFAVGYDRKGGQSRHDVYVGGLKNVLPAISPRSRVVYVSTTGVFHQSGGVSVDEMSPAKPLSDGGRAHLRAESALLNHRRRQTHDAGQYGLAPTVILRLAGLYGPGRVPNMAAIGRGEPIAADPNSYLNLIHVEDAVSSVLAAWRHPHPQSLYLVSDGRPVRRGDYYGFLAEQLDAPGPVFAKPSASGRAGGSKRIDNRAMRKDLVAELAYPSYREGLKACLPFPRVR